MSARPRPRTTSLLAGGLAFAALLVVAGCTSSSGAAGTPTPTPTATVTPAPTASNPLGAAGASATVPAVNGYTYVALPSQFDGIIDGFQQTGLAETADGRGVQKTAGGDIVAAVLVVTYKPDLAVTTDKAPLASILDSLANNAKAYSGTGVTIKPQTVAGVQVRIVQSPTLAILVAYKKGGKIVEVYGPTTASVVGFATGFLPLT